MIPALQTAQHGLLGTDDEGVYFFSSFFLGWSLWWSGTDLAAAGLNGAAAAESIFFFLERLWDNGLMN